MIVSISTSFNFIQQNWVWVKRAKNTILGKQCGNNKLPYSLFCNKPLESRDEWIYINYTDKFNIYERIMSLVLVLLWGFRAKLTGYWASVQGRRAESRSSVARPAVCWVLRACRARLPPTASEGSAMLPPGRTSGPVL